MGVRSPQRAVGWLCKQLGLVESLPWWGCARGTRLQLAEKPPKHPRAEPRRAGLMPVAGRRRAASTSCAPARHPSYHSPSGGGLICLADLQFWVTRLKSCFPSPGAVRGSNQIKSKLPGVLRAREAARS